MPTQLVSLLLPPEHVAKCTNTACRCGKLPQSRCVHAQLAQLGDGVQGAERVCGRSECVSRSLTWVGGIVQQHEP